MQSATYFVGTAGAGKSTLVDAYDRWCKQHGISTILVNMDPGAESIPYDPDVDIRDYVKLDEVMEENELGPNGAQVAAADMIALNLNEVKEEIDAFRGDMTLVDTPGQIELFVFRLAGKHIVDNINPEASVIAYLLDPYLSRTPSGFASQLMLGATTFFRFQQPMQFILSKADLVDQESREAIMTWGTDPAALESDILAEAPSMSRELATNVTRLLGSMGVENAITPVSSAETDGLDDLYSLIQGAVGQSEDATPEYDTFLGDKDEVQFN